MDITEKWLGEIGGWQAMKSAREFLRTGAVAEVTHDGKTFRGLVGSGQRKFRAVLVAGDGRNTEAKCACPDGQRGVVCAHALAVALAAIAPPASAAPTASASAGWQKKAPAPKGQGTGTASAAVAKPALVAEKEIPAGEFTVFLAVEALAKLAPEVPAATRASSPRSSPPPTASVPVFLQFQAGGETKEVALVRWLRQREIPISTMPLRLPVADFWSLVAALADHPRVRAGMPDLRGKSAAPQSPLFIQSRLRLRVAASLVEPAFAEFATAKDDFSLIGGPLDAWAWSPTGKILAPLPQGVPPGAAAFLVDLMRTGRQRQPLRWVAEHLDALSQVLESSGEHQLLERIRILPAPTRFQLRLDGHLRRVEARVTALLPDGSAEAQDADYPVVDSTNPLLFFTRNRPAERGATRRLEDAGFQSAPGSKVLELKGEREILQFLSSDLPRLRKQFEIVEGDGWRNATRGLAIIRPKVRPPEKPDQNAVPGPGMDWLSLEVAYEAADGFSISRNEVLRLIRSGKRDVQGRDGRRYLLDADGCEELEEVVQDMESRFEAGNRLAVRARQAEVLENFIERPEVLALHLCPPLDDAALQSRLGSLG
ncbi:MAG: SNF2 helicase associated domain-containing protein, partial [Roseimicrobium sp.]